MKELKAFIKPNMIDYVIDAVRLQRQLLPVSEQQRIHYNCVDGSSRLDISEV